jgi:tetratricopeptide (TPR) repeat protein
LSAITSSLTESEAAQLSQTIEMFEVITRSDPSDYQSLEILKEAYSKLGREKDLIDTSKRIAQVYVQLGQLSSAILEYETVLQRFPEDKEVQMALKEIDARAHNFGTSASNGHSQSHGESQGTHRSSESHTTTIRIRDKSGSGTEVDDGRLSMQKIFVDSKLVSPADFDICWKTPDPLESPMTIAEPFVQVLNDKGIVQTDTSLKLIVEKTRLAYLPMEKYDVDLELARSFSADVCRRWCVLPFDRMSKTLLVATTNPFNRQVAKELMNARHSRVIFFISPPIEIAGSLKKIFR